MFRPSMIAIAALSLLGVVGLARGTWAAELLFKDGDQVVMVATDGPDAQRMGREGRGRFLVPYNAGAKMLGHARVLKHSSQSLTMKGPRGYTCVLSSNRKFRCDKGGNGYWELKK